jgi:tyrosyl-tRNA synthetase
LNWDGNSCGRGNRRECLQQAKAPSDQSGGIKLNGVVVTDEKMTLTSSNATPEGIHILSFGKKRHFQLKQK